MNYLKFLSSYKLTRQNIFLGTLANTLSLSIKFRNIMYVLYIVIYTPLVRWERINSCQLNVITVTAAHSKQYRKNGKEREKMCQVYFPYTTTKLTREFHFSFHRIYCNTHKAKIIRRTLSVKLY